MSKKQLYYHPAYPEYLKALKNMATCGGQISAKLALYDALTRVGVTGRIDSVKQVKCEDGISPDQVRIFLEHFHGDMAYLQKRIALEDYNMRSAWSKFYHAADACGIERTQEDYSDWVRFYKTLRLTEEACDLRSKVHAWVKTEQNRLKSAVASIGAPAPSEDYEAIQMLSVAEINRRYNRLLKIRQKKNA